jgi:D-glycero-alpha-D-manno-heptose 1-phosphate guanylyltransferase
MECIILCGGQGTRIKQVLGETPKCLAPINGTPFLDYLVQYLIHGGCTKLILAVGVGAQYIRDWHSNKNFSIPIIFSEETQPLGTGGALLKATDHIQNESFIALNGDSYSEGDLKALLNFHESHQSECTLLLNYQREIHRYGLVESSEDGKITQFNEKQYAKDGWINAGVYCILKKQFQDRFNVESNFSFENDYLRKYVREGLFYGLKQQSYFIDIGIPEDYEKAQNDFINFPLF